MNQFSLNIQLLMLTFFTTHTSFGMDKLDQLSSQDHTYIVIRYLPYADLRNFKNTSKTNHKVVTPYNAVQQQLTKKYLEKMYRGPIQEAHNIETMYPYLPLFYAFPQQIFYGEILRIKHAFVDCSSLNPTLLKKALFTQKELIRNADDTAEALIPSKLSTFPCSAAYNTKIAQQKKERLPSWDPYHERCDFIIDTKVKMSCLFDADDIFAQQLNEYIQFVSPSDVDTDWMSVCNTGNVLKTLFNIAAHENSQQKCLTILGIANNMLKLKNRIRFYCNILEILKITDKKTLLTITYDTIPSDDLYTPNPDRIYSGETYTFLDLIKGMTDLDKKYSPFDETDYATIRARGGITGEEYKQLQLRKLSIFNL